MALPGLVPSPFPGPRLQHRRWHGQRRLGLCPSCPRSLRPREQGRPHWTTRTGARRLARADGTPLRAPPAPGPSPPPSRRARRPGGCQGRPRRFETTPQQPARGPGEHRGRQLPLSARRAASLPGAQALPPRLSRPRGLARLRRRQRPMRPAAAAARHPPPRREPPQPRRLFQRTLPRSARLRQQRRQRRAAPGSPARLGTARPRQSRRPPR
mmetsp:Transcript_11255/g.43407  ORF Transcript_11255/g.43407 Transcript_11255/m.43407 type:complete len:212 (+) Transcript_11255:581-1216(+)